MDQHFSLDQPTIRSGEHIHISEVGFILDIPLSPLQTSFIPSFIQTPRMWPQTESKKKYFGLNTSLYSTLDSETIEHLEKAIYFTRLCFYDEAQSIFEDKLSALKHIPVVIIEWAELFLLQLRLRDAINILESGFKASQDHDIDVDFDLTEYRLMRLFIGLCEIEGKGRLEGALQEIGRTVDWLTQVPVEEYSDVQVSLSSIQTDINRDYVDRKPNQTRLITSANTSIPYIA